MNLNDTIAMPGSWESSLRIPKKKEKLSKNNTALSVSSEEEEEKKESESVFSGSSRTIRRRTSSIGSTQSTRSVRSYSSKFGLRLTDSELTRSSSNAVGAGEIKVAPEQQRVEYFQYNDENDDVSVTELNSTVVYNDTKKVYMQCIEPNAVKVLGGENASSLLMEWDPDMVVLSCQTLFQTSVILASLSKEFEQHRDVPLEKSICVSWIQVEGDGTMRDVLGEIARNQQGTVRVEDPVLEVRVSTVMDVIQLVQRIGMEYKDPMVHRVINIYITKEDEMRTRNRLQLVFANPREKTQMDRLNEVLESIERKLPRVPYHASRLGGFLREALTDRENFSVVGSIDCTSTAGDSQVLHDSELGQSTLNIIARLQTICATGGVEDHCDASSDEMLEQIFAAPQEETDQVEDLIEVGDGEQQEEDNEEEAEIVLSEIEEARLKCTDFSVVLEQYLSDHEQHTPVVSEMSKWFHSLVSKLETLTTKNSDLETSMETLARQNMELIEEKESISSRFDQVKEVNTRYSEEILRLQRIVTINVLTSPVAGHNDAGFDESSEDDLDIENDTCSLQERLRSAKADFKIYKQVMETTIVRLQNELSGLIETRNEQNDEMEKLRARSRRDRNNAMEQSRNCKELGEKLQSMHHESQVAKLEFETLNDIHKAMSSNARKCKGDLKAANRRKKDLESQVKQLREDMEKMRSDLEMKFARERRNLNKKLSDANELIHSLLADDGKAIGQLEEEGVLVDLEEGEEVAMEEEEEKKVLPPSNDEIHDALKRRSSSITKETFTESLLNGLKARRMQRSQSVGCKPLPKSIEKTIKSTQRRASSPVAVIKSKQGNSTPKPKPFRLRKKPDWGVGPGRRILQNK